MKLQIQCSVCGVKCWTRGTIEDDINAVAFDENDPMEDDCEHIKNGADFTVIDQEADDFDD